MKLSIQGLDAHTSAELIKAVLKVCRITEDQFTAIIGDTIETTVDCCSSEGETEHNLNRIALLYPGNNAPKTIQAIRDYIIVGDGDCDRCGGDDIFQRGIFNYCRICGKEWEIKPERETAKYYEL